MDAGTRSHRATVLRWRSSRAVIAGVAVAFAVAACGPSTGASPSAAVASAPVGSATPAGSGSAAPPSGEPIKVAQIAAHSGQLAQLGDWDKEALDLAFKEKNDAGGVCGRPLELTVFDDQGDPTVGVNVTRQALDTGIVAAFATTESAVTLAAVPLFADAKVPHFTAGQSDAITKEGSAYVFRDGPPAAAFNKTLADYALKTKGWTKIAMVTNTGGYGDSERKAFAAQLTAANVNPSSMQRWRPKRKSSPHRSTTSSALRPRRSIRAWRRSRTGSSPSNCENSASRFR